MKKKFLAGLTTGLFMAALVGLSQAAPDRSGDDVYNDNNPCDWNDFEEYEIKADIKMLRDEALKAIPAAGFPQEKDDLYVEANDCDWSEFKSPLE